MKPAVAITGGAGNLAAYVARGLSSEHSLRLLDLKSPTDPRPGESMIVDLVDLDGLIKALDGVTCVVHLGAIPHPMHDPPERVFRVNAMGTFNVLEASARLRIPRVVMASSDSILGFVFRKRELSPLYLPMDEDHPIHPQDPYALSKRVGEEICRSYSEAYGIVTLCLRFCHIWYPQNASGYKSLVDSPEPGIHNLWVYVDARDAAEAVRLGCGSEGFLHEVVYIAGPSAASREDSRSLAKRFYPATTVLKEGFTGRSSFVSCEKAKKILGYQPQWTWQKFLGEEGTQRLGAQ